MTKFNFTAARQAHIGTAGFYQLSIDHKGVSPTYIKSVEGGYPKANVIEEQVGQDLGFVKHTSTAEIEAMSFEIGMQSGIDILRWIQDSWRRNFSRRSGSVSHGNFDAKTVLEHEFYDALITETTFPTLDAAGRDGAYLKFKIQPERVELKPGNKEKLHAALPPQAEAVDAVGVPLRARRRRHLQGQQGRIVHGQPGREAAVHRRRPLPAVRADQPQVPGPHDPHEQALVGVDR